MFYHYEARPTCKSVALLILYSFEKEQAINDGYSEPFLAW